MDCVLTMNSTSSSNVEVVQTLYGPKVINKTPRHPDLPQSAFRRVYPSENRPCQNTLREGSRNYAPVDRTTYGRAARFSSASPYPRRPAHFPSRLPISTPPPPPSGYPSSPLAFIENALQRCADSLQRYTECRQVFTREIEASAQSFHDALDDVGYVCREAIEESRLETERWKTRCTALERRLELMTLERKTEADRRSYGNLEEHNIPQGFATSSRPRPSSSRCGMDDFFDVTVVGYDSRPTSSSAPPQIRRIGDEPPRLCPRPAKPGGLDMSYLDLMYIPRERQLICCACTKNAERKSRRSGKRKSVKTFSNNASWNELLRHWLTKHPTECRDITNSHPTEFRDTFRRFESTAFG